MSQVPETDLLGLQNKLEQRDRQLASIHQITAALRAQTRVKALVEEALRVSLACVGANDGAVILYHPETNKLVFNYVIGSRADELIGAEIPVDRGLAGAVFQSGQTRVSESLEYACNDATAIEKTSTCQAYNLVIVPLKSPEGRILGVMQVLNKREGQFDAGDLEVLEILGGQIALALESARLYEEARLAEIVRFIGNLSHDVKNMITPVQTGAETLRLIADDTYAQLTELLTAEKLPQSLAEAWRVLDDLRRVYPEMLGMVLDGCAAIQQRMIEISAAVKGIVSEPHFQRQQLAGVIEKSLTPLKLVGERLGITVSYEPQGDLPEIDIDERQISNALYNLVNNALQATAAEGRVTVTTRLSSSGEFPEVSAGQVVVLEVKDMGEGMSAEVKARAFTDNAISTKPMGTGLGTKIVKNVMDVHRGKIEVESEVGQGTTIRCLLPLEHIPNEE